MDVVFKQNQLILFQGDSVTDAGRDHFDFRDLGKGYANIAASLISADKPEFNLNFLNRGVSGDTCADLLKRWDRDCLDLKPDWVSILIGINDTWRCYDSNEVTTAGSYISQYRSLLDQTLEATDAKLILCEPFLLHTTDDLISWRDDLDPKIETVHKLAQEYNAILVRFDHHFQKAAGNTNPLYWAEDGVHPTAAGFGFMSQIWLDAVSKPTNSEVGNV